MDNCPFCKIIAGEIPAKKVYEDDKMLAFLDIQPQAPVHVLCIPKEHIASTDEIDEGNAAIVAHIFAKIPQIAREQGSDGYRVITNCGHDGMQTVPHLHFHILGGRELGLGLVSK